MKLYEVSIPRLNGGKSRLFVEATYRASDGLVSVLRSWLMPSKTPRYSDDFCVAERLAVYEEVRRQERAGQS